MTDVLTVFFALLSFISLLGAAAITWGMRSSYRSTVVDAVRPYAMPAAATVATVCTLGSLYLSEIANFTPCRLCWVQRGFMYPMAIVLWLAAWKQWDRVARPTIPWSLLGAAVAIFHFAEQRGWVGGEEFCSVETPCSAIWVEHFGFVTIPFMALAGFLFIAALMWVEQAARPADQPMRETTPIRSN